MYRSEDLICPLTPPWKNAMTAVIDHQPTAADLTAETLIIALAEVFADHQAEFIATAKGLVHGDRHLSEEIVQDAYVQALSQTDIAASSPDSVVEWMQHTIADMASDANRGTFHAETGDPAVLRAQYKATDSVLSALKALNPIDRFVLVLSAAGFTYEQIAQASDGASVAHVEAGINAARTQLAQRTAEPARRCKKTTERAGAYVDQTLSMKDRGAVERHMLSCQDCAALIDRMVEQRAALAASTPRALHALDGDSLPVASRAARGPVWTPAPEATPAARQTTTTIEPDVVDADEFAAVAEPDVPATTADEAATRQPSEPADDNLPFLDDPVAENTADTSADVDESSDLAAIVDQIISSAAAPAPVTPTAGEGEAVGLSRLVAIMDDDGVSLVDDTGEIPVVDSPAATQEPAMKPVHGESDAPVSATAGASEAARQADPIRVSDTAAEAPAGNLNISESRVVSVPVRTTTAAAASTPAKRRCRSARRPRKGALITAVSALAAFAIVTGAQHIAKGPTTPEAAATAPAATAPAATATTPPSGASRPSVEAPAPAKPTSVAKPTRAAKPTKRVAASAATPTRSTTRTTVTAARRASTRSSTRSSHRGSGAAAEFTP